jgi:hypothetical protein
MHVLLDTPLTCTMLAVLLTKLVMSIRAST